MGPMQGVTVVEMGLGVAGPSGGGILADWGADVIKIEPLAGDPFRSLEWVYGEGVNPPFELDNRGKRSIAVDITMEGGMAVVHRFLERADVFLTNYRLAGLERVGLDHETLLERYPDLIYAQVSGYGMEGEERNRAAYDVGAWWGRAGVASAITPDGVDLPYPRGGMGDHMTGLAAAGGVAAALFDRTRTGRGQLVATSLLRNGAYLLGWDHNVNLRTGLDTEPQTRKDPPNPLINGYRCGDGRWVWLLGMEGDRHWPKVVAALGHPAWADDPRFADMEGRRDHSADLVAAIDGVLATRPRDEWADVFDRHDVWWAPVQHTHELADDPQARDAGCLVDVPMSDGSTETMVASPVDFGRAEWSVREPAPELGQHTELLLVELGIDWDHIEAMKSQGVIP